MTAVRSFWDLGDAIVGRLAGEKLPPMMKPSADAFKKAHAAYVAAAESARSAEQARNEKLLEVGAKDELLDAAVEALATSVIGAGLGKRTRPLASFTRYAVSQLTGLAYRNEADEVVAMCERLLATNPPKEVAAAAKACVKLAKGVDAALAAVTSPQAKYASALGARDALLPGWSKALKTLKKHAAAAWVDDDHKVRAMFAAPDAVQAPTKRRKKTSAPKTPPATPPNG